jgi:F5/8 type C domain-containing protein
MPRLRPFALAGALYFVLSCAVTWPLVSHLGTHVANDLGDPLLNMWIMAWNAHEMPLTAAWWNQAQFFPIEGVTAFSEHLLGLSPIATPVLLATNNPVLAYNLAVFLAFPFAALAGHAFGWSVTRRHDAAIITGLAFGFAPYRMAQLAHVQVLSSYWMPLSLLGLVQYFHQPPGERRIGWLVLFAGAWLMQALTCGYYFFYLSVLVGLWLIWFVVGRESWKELARVIALWAVAVALMTPVLLGYVRYQGKYGFRRWPNEIAGFSADVASLLKASGNVLLWGWLNVFERAESELFPGLTIVLLVAATIVVCWRAEAAGRPRLRTARVLAAAGVLFLLIAPTPIFFGDWKLELFGVKLLSVSKPHKPFTVAVVLLLAAAALNPTVRAVWARRSKFAFFAAAAVAMWLFCLGPTPTFLNKPFLYKAPYTWLMWVPGMEGVRVPARFWMLAVLCLATAGALAFVRLSARWPRARSVLLGVVCIGILADGWPTPMSMKEPPPRSPNRTSAVARLDLPLDEGHDLKALYWGISHRRPLFNGYSGYFAPHYWVLRFLVHQGEHDVLTHLAQFGDVEVVVDLLNEDAEPARRYVESYPGVERVHTDEGRANFRIRQSAKTLSHKRLSGSTLPLAGATSTMKPELLPRMTDGDLVSRWEAGRPQRVGDSVTLDLGSPRDFRGIELDLGGYVADFPRKLSIETSVDGVAWEEGWSGSGGGPALTGALQDPKLMPLTFQVTPRKARYIRLTQLGSDPAFYWTIAELKIFGT